MSENKLTKHTDILAEKKLQVTYDKVTKALNKLKKGKKKISVSLVAREADVERKTLYNRKELMELIREAQSLVKDKLNPDKSFADETPEKRKTNKVSKTQTEIINRLRNDKKEFIEEKSKLLEENMRLTSEITTLERRIAILEERLHRNQGLKVVDFNKDKE